jgi:hypothetical protein
VTETTYESKQVFIVDNSKGLKACPKDQCNCPCACKRGGNKSGKSSGAKSGGKSKGGKSGKKSGGKSKGGKSKKGNNGKGWGVGGKSK